MDTRGQLPDEAVWILAALIILISGLGLTFGSGFWDLLSSF